MDLRTQKRKTAFAKNAALNKKCHSSWHELARKRTSECPWVQHTIERFFNRNGKYIMEMVASKASIFKGTARPWLLWSNVMSPLSKRNWMLEHKFYPTTMFFCKLSWITAGNVIPAPQSQSDRKDGLLKACACRELLKSIWLYLGIEQSFWKDGSKLHMRLWPDMKCHSAEGPLLIRIKSQYLSRP